MSLLGRVTAETVVALSVPSLLTFVNAFAEREIVFSYLPVTPSTTIIE